MMFLSARGVRRVVSSTLGGETWALSRDWEETLKQRSFTAVHRGDNFFDRHFDRLKIVPAVTLKLSVNAVLT